MMLERLPPESRSTPDQIGPRLPDLGEDRFHLGLGHRVFRDHGHNLQLHYDRYLGAGLQKEKKEKGHVREPRHGLLCPGTLSLGLVENTHQQPCGRVHNPSEPSI